MFFYWSDSNLCDQFLFIMNERNRAEGWQHAKLSGHKNEDLVTALIMGDIKIQERLLKSASKTGKIISVEEGGLCEKLIPSVLSGGTKAKPDMRLNLNTNDHINVSLKKSLCGQVYLISIERFVIGFELQYNKKIPFEVKKAMSLFWGTAQNIVQLTNQYAKVEIPYQIKKHRLVKDTMDRINPQLSIVLLEWFKTNIVDIFDFCFVRGLAKNKEDWADVIWYKNLLKGEMDGDTMINLKELKGKLQDNVDLVCYGTKTGGSTIQLPFGFVQWHQGKMQFHHNLKVIKSLYQ